MTPIYNDPDHPCYGPCRRVHLILLYLYGYALTELEAMFTSVHGYDWTECIGRELYSECEGRAARYVIRCFDELFWT